MTYNLFLFIKLHEVYLNSELEYDLLFAEVLSLYEIWEEWDSKFGAVYNTYESMEQFLLEVNAN
jgi:hypothetical protein